MDYAGFMERKKNAFTPHAQKRYPFSSREEKDSHVRSVQLNRRNKITPGEHIASADFKSSRNISEKNRSQEDNASFAEGSVPLFQAMTQEVRNTQSKS